MKKECCLCRRSIVLLCKKNADGYICNKCKKYIPSKINLKYADAEYLKSLYEEISKLINNNKFDEAKKTISKIETERNAKHFSYFFQGYIEYYNDNKKQAEILFESSHILKSDFWPAFFYHGLVLKDIGNSQKASVCFEKCLSLVKEKNLHDKYGFIFDSFSPSYIESICRNLS